MKNWELSEEGLIRLLARLNPDSALAGEEYEKLRTRLIYFFERKGCRIPDELGDETINRMARKIEEGLEIKDVFKFSFGVARLVLLEHWDDSKREWERLDDRFSSPLIDQEFDDHRLDCMKKCLQGISPEERNLIVQNCTLNKNGREKAALGMGLTINAYRLRVFRIRARLNRCYEKCVKVYKG